jgi:predicted PurR-regulated permease PerM
VRYVSGRVGFNTIESADARCFISLIIGGALAGVLGALVAVPTAALVAVIIDDTW